MKRIVEHPQAPLLTLGFEFLSEDWNTLDLPPIDTELRCSGYYKVWIDGGLFDAGWVPLVDKKYLYWKPDRYYPQWPWAYAYCAAFGDVSTPIAIIRVNLLLGAIEEFDDRHGYLDEFVAPRAASKWEISGESFDRWMTLMYPVTSSIRSRFHSPCDPMEQRYGHLS